MRMMMKVSIPVGQGNKALKEGLLPKTVMGFVETAKPEASYFTLDNGKRTAFFYFDLKDSTMMPVYAEPFFQNLDAEITWSPVMDLGDLKAGLDKVGKSL